MKLIDYGAGEVADRLTILALKLHHAGESGKPLDHFRNEQVKLLVKLKAANGVGGYLEDLLELATVNGLLWHAEDVLREFRRQSDNLLPAPEREGTRDAIVLTAFRIQALNDRRAQLVQAINTQTGDHTGSEKL